MISDNGGSTSARSGDGGGYSEEASTPGSDNYSFILPTTAFKTEEDARKIHAFIEEVRIKFLERSFQILQILVYFWGLLTQRKGYLWAKKQ